MGNKRKGEDLKNRERIETEIIKKHTQARNARDAQHRFSHHKKHRDDKADK